MHFLAIWVATPILKANCVEITTDRLAKLAYENFDIKRRFKQSQVSTM